MSMNLYVDATREVTVNKTGKHSTQTSVFQVYQTPTKVTRQILAALDKALAYIEWVLAERSSDEVEEIFDTETDLFSDKVIGTRVYNAGKQHVAEFQQWLNECEDEGYTVEFSEV